MDGLIESVLSDDAQDGSEDFFLVAGVVGLNVVDDGGSNEISLGVGWVGVVSSIEGEGGSFLDSGVEESEDSVSQLWVTEWSQIDSLVNSGSDLEFLDLLDDLVQPFLALSDQDNSGQGHTSLSGGSECGTDDGVDGVLSVSVWQDDAVVLGSHIDLHSLEGLGSLLVDVVSGLVSSDEGDGLDIGVLGDVLGGVETSVDELEDTLGDSDFLDELGQVDGGVGDSFGRLEDEGVSESDGVREHPQWDHAGEVEWSNTSTNSQGESVGVAVNTSGDVREGFSHVDVGQSAGVLNDLESSGDVSSGIGDSFSVFLSDELSQLFHISSNSSL